MENSLCKESCTCSDTGFSKVGKKCISAFALLPPQSWCGCFMYDKIFFIRFIDLEAGEDVAKERLFLYYTSGQVFPWACYQRKGENLAFASYTRPGLKY